MSSSSLKVKLSDRQRKKLSEQVSKCIFFRADDPKSADILNQGIVAYTQAYSSGNARIQFQNKIKVELIEMGELFDKAIDLILNESVGATIYAFERLPKDYKKCLVHFAKRNVELFDEDPALVLSYLKYDLEDVQDEIKNVIGDDFKKLSIDCSDIHVKQEEEFPSLSVGGRFHSKEKARDIPSSKFDGCRSVFTEPLVEFNPNIDTKLLQEKILSCRADFIATLAVENLIHELSHLAFPCVTEQKVVDYL